ncbi:MAG: diguanylate cyclase [Clostridia bacterium]|nr:diguanylate cyclase [Clostridia bacterium]MBR2177433.1 diguanylate cyclase [Clostridia bacterium]
MKKMLVADNIEMNKSIVHEIFAAQYEIIQTNSSEVAFKFLIQYKSDISVVLMNETIAHSLNKELVQTLADLKIFENVPIIIITNGESERTRLQGIELPYSDIIISPVNPYVIQKRVANLVELYYHKREMELLIQKQTAKILSQNKALKLQQRKINTINNDMLDTLSTVIEYRDVESGRHIHRIRKFTEVMLRALALKYPEYKMTEEKINLITSASSLHDIGKIAIPDSILLSPRRLTYEEFNIMKQHTIKGCELLNQLDSVERNEYFTYCYDICRYHHEKYDGKGYPDGLVGDRIPIWAQVVSVADCYDALTSERPYKAAFSHEQAVEMIRTGACGAFSEVMMDCFGSVLPDFKKLAAQYADITHVDRSISDKSGDDAQKTEVGDSTQDVYKKMNREDLIRTIETQKQDMIETCKRENEVLNRISDFVFEFDLRKDTASERKGSFEDVFGYAPKNYSEAIMLFTELCPDEYRSKFSRTFRLDNLMNDIKNGSDRTVLECPMKLGEDIYTAARCSVVPFADDDSVKRIVFSIQTLNHSSVTVGMNELVTNRDTITGLWNFNGLRNEIDDFIAHAGKNGSHIMILIDIDGFRTINRQTGYRFGNEILKDIAEVLRQQFTDSNIIGRVEDDNFIVFVKDCPDKEEALLVVDSIFRHLHKTYTFNGKTYPEISASIGVAAYPEHGSTFEEIFTNASKTVDIAKINGKNMYLFFNDNMKGSWDIQTYQTPGMSGSTKYVKGFERFFVPVVDSVNDRVLTYDLFETSLDYSEEFDFDEIYSALYLSNNVSGISLNILRRIFSTIYTLEQEGIKMPKISVVTMFNGYDSDIIMRAFEELLNYYPINCRNIRIQITQEMLSGMDVNRVAEFTKFLKSCGFEIGVYNVGLDSINTKCFTNRLFSSVTFANSFLNDIADGIIPVEILIYLIECFTGLGAESYLPVNADPELIKLLRQKCDIGFGLHTDEVISVDSFKSRLQDESLRAEYPILEHEKNSLVLSEKMYDEILEQTRSFIFEWVPRLDSIKFSSSFERMYGYMPGMYDFVKNLRKTDLIHSDDIRKFLEKLNFARSEFFDAECLIRFYSIREEAYIWNRVHFVAVRNAAGVPAKIMAICADVSEERTNSADDEIRRDRTDFITSLYNRSATENKIKTYLYDEGASGGHALIISEVYGFEAVESALGKVFANAVLKEIASNVRELFRDSDIIGRVSGSQFVIFVKGLSSTAKLKVKAEEICSVINHRYQSDSGEISICGKIGISLFPSDGYSYEELYASALNALYFAKHSISSNTVFAGDTYGAKRLTADSDS